MKLRKMIEIPQKFGWNLGILLLFSKKILIICIHKSQVNIKTQYLYKIIEFYHKFSLEI